MKIEEIAEKLRTISFSPGELSDWRSYLGGEYAYLNGQLSEILMKKPAIWNELRRTYQSDKATDRIWEATQDGLKETELRLKLRSIDKLQAAIKTQIEIHQGEARGLY